MSAPFTVVLNGNTYNLTAPRSPAGSCNGCVFKQQDACIWSVQNIAAQSGHDCSKNTLLVFLGADQATEDQIALDNIANRLTK